MGGSFFFIIEIYFTARGIFYAKEVIVNLVVFLFLEFLFGVAGLDDLLDASEVIFIHHTLAIIIYEESKNVLGSSKGEVKINI